MEHISENYLHSDITEKIIREAYYVYNALGPGYLEKVYENALSIRLRKIGLKTTQQTPISVYFEDIVVGEYYSDLFVEDKIIVELKACENLTKIFEVQLVGYLKSTGVEVGLLINFGAEKLQVKRKVNSKNLNSAKNHNIHKNLR